MREFVVISGKGGTGKTSIVASLAALAENAVLADCDVDAADLHLVLDPKIITREDFSGGSRAQIESSRCTACGKCKDICRFDAIHFDGPGNAKADKAYRVDPIGCEGCGVCAWFCTENAIEFGPVVNGEWSISDTRYGPMVHAKLGVAEENSGKLVNLVRTQAKQIAQNRGRHLVLIDGSPGIGCPVIASIAGADLALVVTEPTRSGLHDLERVADLTKHFGIETLLCVNKWDLNENIASQIQIRAAQRGVRLAGKVRYDRAVTEAQIRKLSVVEYARGGVAGDIKDLWANILTSLNLAAKADASRDIKTENERKENPRMKIAIPVADGRLCMHFGHCEQFAIVETDEQSNIVNKMLLTPPPHEPGVLPRWLGEQGANVIIAGGMGMRAQQLFAQNGITVIVGAPAQEPEKLVSAYLTETLQTGENACDH